MEKYRSYCPNCNAEYTWTGYKTGLGKSQAQLEEMRKEQTVCKKCQSEGLETELDFGTSIRHKYEIQKPSWVEKLQRLKEGAFKDEFQYALNRLLELPEEEKPTEEQILSFIIECVKKDFKEVLFQWNKTIGKE